MVASSGTRRSGSGVTTARPQRRGARKSMVTRPKDWLEQTRKMWADHANQALARVGSKERITGASLEQTHRDALEAGDEREAARLKYREPGCAHRAAQRRQSRVRGGAGANCEGEGGGGSQSGV